MINNCRIELNSIYITTENGETIVKWNKDIKSVICDDINIFVHSVDDECEIVEVLAEDGSVKAFVKATKEFYIMYLSKHPRFGLCIVGSELQEDGLWKDGYYKFDGQDGFEKATNFR